jgi:hypothetical protein
MENSRQFCKRIMCQVWAILFVFNVLGNCAFAAVENLSSPAQVHSYVDSLTGFGTLEETTKSLALIDVNDDNTPFLQSQINGKKGVWRVEINNVRLKLKSAVPSFKDKYVRRFEVLIDPNTGHLLRIRSTFDGNDPNMLPMPSAAIAEKQIRNNDEVYHGFPPDPPNMTFLDALDSVGARGMGSPYRAKEIYGSYVLRSTTFEPEPRPSWVITLRGLDPPPMMWTRTPRGGFTAASMADQPRAKCCRCCDRPCRSNDDISSTDTTKEENRN